MSFRYRYLQTTPRHPPDTPKASPGNATCQQTISNRHPKTLTGDVWRCRFASVVVCCSLEYLEVSVGCLLGVCGISVGCLGYLSGFQGNLRRLNVFWGHLGSHSLQYGTKTLFWDSPKSKTFFHVTAYKLSKNH